MFVQSDVYALKDGALVLNPARTIPKAPLIELSNEFKKVSDRPALTYPTTTADKFFRHPHSEQNNEESDIYPFG